MLIKGEIDCSHLYEPMKTQALLNSNTRELFNGVYPFFNEPSAIGISVISRSFYSEKRELSIRLLKVWDRSIDFIRNNDVEARKILMRELKLSEEVAFKSTWVDATLTSEVSEADILRTIMSLQKIFQDSSFQFSSDYLLKE